MISVIGSINLDKVYTVDKLPQKGQTLKANNYQEFAGGKGANQAVAASRLGARVTFFGCVGEDTDGEKMINNLQYEHINTRFIKKGNEPTGTAVIFVGDEDNIIVVNPGANKEVTTDYIDQNNVLFKESRFIILQNEVPYETVKYVIEKYHNFARIIYNPAPYTKVEPALLKKVFLSTPNYEECLSLFGSIEQAFETLRTRLVVTNGSEGVMYYDNGIKTIPSLKVKVHDTTGAGDTFNGALVAFLEKGLSTIQSLKFANAAAALSVTQMGAQSGMPTYYELVDFINKRI